MPPTSTLQDFIDALRTGETKTTRALEAVFRRIRMGEFQRAWAAVSAHPDALNSPLTDDVLNAVKSHLDHPTITQCIDGWPNGGKERARQALVVALSENRSVCFRWGLTNAAEYDVVVTMPDDLSMTITALTPRTTLRIYAGDQVAAGPVMPPPG